MTNIFAWTGISGEQYTYYVYDLPISFKEGQGNYIYCRVDNNQWIPIYVGEGDLADRVSKNHHQAACIKAKSATYVHAHLTNSKQESLKEETDLLAMYPIAYKPTGCNERLGG